MATIPQTFPGGTIKKTTESHWRSMLFDRIAWRKRGNLSDRYVQNINKDEEKISSSKEEKTSITVSIGKLDGGTTECHGKPVGSIFIFTIAVVRSSAHGILHNLKYGGEFGFLREV